MSIDELGRGLVNESRKVRRRQRKKQERYAQRAALAQIALPIGARIIEDGLMQKAQDFFQSEEVLNLKRQQANAVREASSIFATRDAITASGKSDEEYFYDQVYDTVQSEMVDAARSRQQTEDINILGEHIESGIPLNQEFIGSIKKAAQELSNTKAEQYRESLGAAENVVSSEEFDAMMVSKLKDTTPTNIVDSIGRKISTIFGGTSTAERQQMALNDIRSHHFSDSAAALSAFNKEYEKTRSIRDALDYAGIVTEIEEYTPRLKDEVPGTQIITKRDGEIVTLNWTQPIYADGTKGEITYESPQNIPGLGSVMTPAEERQEVEAAKRNFHVGVMGRRLVGDDVFYEEFVDKHLKEVDLRKADGTRLLPSTNVDNLEDYNALLKEWNSWFSDNRDKIIDPHEEALAEELLRVGVTLANENDDLKQLRDNLNAVGLGEFIDNPEYQMVFDHIVQADMGNVEMGVGIDSGILFKFSSLATNHIDYLTKWEAFRNIANTESAFYELIRRGTNLD